VSAVIFPREVYATIRAHGEETYPHECCGALLGRNEDGEWSVVEAVRAGNTRTDSAHNRYHIAPHPDHPAQWSQTDFAEAHWLGCCYVITEVAHGKAAVTNSFLLAGTSEEDKRFELQTIEVQEKL
jgi:proteasome lid subunit RPN8/RPN11